MDWLVIEGLKPWDGRYELDLIERSPTLREWIWIGKYAEIMPTDWAYAIRSRNQALNAVLGIMALHRAGKIDEAEVPDLWERMLDDVGTGTLRYEIGDEAEADDAGPPAGSSNGKTSSSGAGSRTSSEPSADDLNPTGPLVSATSGSATGTSAT